VVTRELVEATDFIDGAAILQTKLVKCGSRACLRWRCVSGRSVVWHSAIAGKPAPTFLAVWLLMWRTVYGDGGL